MSNYKKKIGNYGEALAVAYLERKGYVIVHKNYGTPYGEVDIIAKKEEILVFVEVKMRTSLRYGMPEEAISSTKQRHLWAAATLYQQKFHVGARDLRFDVIAIQSIGSRYVLRHYENAFEGYI